MNSVTDGGVAHLSAMALLADNWHAENFYHRAEAETSMKTARGSGGTSQDIDCSVLSRNSWDITALCKGTFEIHPQCRCPLRLASWLPNRPPP
jgi:hypothetical protein